MSGFLIQRLEKPPDFLGCQDLAPRRRRRGLLERLDVFAFWPGLACPPLGGTEDVREGLDKAAPIGRLPVAGGLFQLLGEVPPQQVPIGRDLFLFLEGMDTLWIPYPPILFKRSDLWT